jgi:hypothetical protein
MTGLAHRIHNLVKTGNLTEAEALLPPERPYPLPTEIATPLRA